MLRQLSAIFDTRALGYSSALVAAKVDPDHIDEAAAIISRHPGVSHNYKRNHAYNLWYTIAVPPGESLDEHIDVLHRESGALVTRKLPTLQALQDRRQARHDRQDRGQREGRGARARDAGAQGRDAGARPHATSSSRRSASCRRTCRTSSARSRRRPSRLGVDEDDVLDMLALVQGAQADAPLRRGDEPPQRGLQGERDGRVGRARRRARRDRPADGRLRRGEPLLPAADVRRLALQRVHDGARPQRARLRSDDRRDPRPRPASTSTACSGRSRSTRRCGSGTSRPSGTSGKKSISRDRRSESPRRNGRRSARTWVPEPVRLRSRTTHADAPVGGARQPRHGASGRDRGCDCRSRDRPVDHRAHHRRGDVRHVRRRRAGRAGHGRGDHRHSRDARHRQRVRRPGRVGRCHDRRPRARVQRVGGRLLRAIGRRRGPGRRVSRRDWPRPGSRPRWAATSARS